MTGLDGSSGVIGMTGSDGSSGVIGTLWFSEFEFPASPV